MSEDAIIFNGLSKYYGQIRAVCDLSFAIPRGAVCGLLGPNGAGKTTTFRILCGYLKPTGGSVTIFGHKPGSEPLLHGRVLALPQDAILPSSSTIRAFLRYLGSLQGLSGQKLVAEVERVLSLVGLTDAGGQSGKSMSHGMARRVALASSLLGSPEVVLLDEPTGGLDPRNAHAVRQIISALAGKCTVVIASHNLAEIQEICSHVAIIDHGKLTAFGTVADLCRRGEHFIISLGKEPDMKALKAALPETKLNWDKEKNELFCQRNGETDIPLDELTRRVLGELIKTRAVIQALKMGESLEKRYLELT